MVLLAGGLAASSWPMMNLLPAFTTHILERAEGSYSVLLSSIGIGALIAALSVATYGTPERQRPFLVTGIGIVSLALMGLAFAPAFGIAIGCCGLFGFGMILFFATGQSAVQLRTDDHSRGRVMGIWVMMLSGSVPMGNLVLGPLADRIGEPWVIFSQGIAVGCLFGVAMITLRLQRPNPQATELTKPENTVH